jgi:hypothetical protein
MKQVVQIRIVVIFLLLLCLFHVNAAPGSSSIVRNATSKIIQNRTVSEPSKDAKEKVELLAFMKALLKKVITSMESLKNGSNSSLAFIKRNSTFLIPGLGENNQTSSGIAIELDDDGSGIPKDIDKGPGDSLNSNSTGGASALPVGTPIVIVFPAGIP